MRAIIIGCIIALIVSLILLFTAPTLIVEADILRLEPGEKLVNHSRDTFLVKCKGVYKLYDAEGHLLRTIVEVSP